MFSNPRSLPAAWRAESKGQYKRGSSKRPVFRCHHRSSFPASGRAGNGLKEPSSMEFQDKVLKCIDCGTDFIFTAGEQLFFHDKQFKNEPKRCKACKGKRISVLGAPTP